MSGRKRMTRIPPAPQGDDWTGPVMVRGWLRVSRPWRRPFAVLTLLRKWMRVKRDVDRAEGLLSFEYWQRLGSLTFGMHVGWERREQLQRFDSCPSHRDIAAWAMASPLVCAMKLEAMALRGDGRLVRLGGFHICAGEIDLPPDDLFPRAGGRR